MQLAEHPGFITSLLQQFPKGLLVKIELRTIGIVYKSIFMAVFSSEYSGSGRAANGIGYQGVIESHTLIRYAVNIGGWCHIGQPSTIGTYGLIGVVIADDEHNIGSFFNRFWRFGGWGIFARKQGKDCKKEDNMNFHESGNLVVSI